MLLTLDQVIEGLDLGCKYKRMLDGGGFEYLRGLHPAQPGMFTHIVAGESELGGYGGQADLPLTILYNGRWANNGWMEDED